MKADSIIPKMTGRGVVLPTAKINSFSFHVKAGLTQGAIFNPGITYNQSGVKYNDNYGYGGYFGNSDVIPLISKSFSPIPSIRKSGDIYTPYVPPSANHGMLIGMLGLTYP